MRYAITHTTTYSYSEPVPVCQNLVMLTPRDSDIVTCHKHRLLIQPQPRYLDRRLDYHGNVVHGFSIEESHLRLRVVAHSQVTVQAAAATNPEASPSWEYVRDGISQQREVDWWDACPFVFDSPRIRRAVGFAEYAREVFPADRPLVAAVHELTAKIHDDFEYDKDATDVTTTPEEALRLKKGVCQDFAHVAIACLRSLGLAARYISGYLRTQPLAGERRRVGADQSHAWLSVYAGPQGWVSFDPTNNEICGTQHVPMAWGRDFGDVVPIRGVFLGGGKHQLHVAVEVTPVAIRDAP